MIRRSRISVRPNVRPGGRPSGASSQDAAKPNPDLSSQGSEQTEPVPEQQVPSAPTQAPSNDAQKPEPATPALSKLERIPQASVSVSEPQSQTPALDERLSQPSPSPSTAAPSNTDNDTLSPHTSTSPSQTSTTSIKPFSSSRGAVNTDTVPSTTTTTASEQVKTTDKAPPLRRPKTRPSLPAVPRQPRARPKEDPKQPVAQQQKDVTPTDKGNTETQVPDVFETGPSQEAPPPPAVTQPSDTAAPSPTSDILTQKEATEALKQKKETEITAERLKRKLAVISAAEKGKPKQPEVRSYGLKDSTDLIRLGKAKKLRELLKLEICKEKNQKTLLVKTKRIQYDTVKDPSKMTMRELIYYLPKTNPMKEISSEERVLPQSKQLSQQPVAEPEPEQRDEEEDDDEAAVLSGEDVSEPLLVPQVKVAEDGTLIIDEQSLTVQVNRMEGPNPTAERDPVFERGSTTTYSSFRKGTYTKPWSSQETDMFFLAISMVGTDFSMIGSMFPHRARSEIKNKFKKEERANAWRIDKAFRERRRLDLEFFTELLDKILSEEERRKKCNAKGGQKRERRPRAKKPKKKVVAADTEDSAGEDLMDLAEGEKENEDCLSDQGTANRKTQKKKKSSEAADTPPKKKTTTKRKKAPETDPDGGASVEVELQDDEGTGSPMKDDRRKSSRKPRSKTVQSSADEGDGGTEETAKPAAKKKRKAEASPPSKTKKSKKGESTDVDEESPSRTGRLKRKRPQPKLPTKERGAGKKDRPLTQSSDDNSNVDSTGRHGKKQKRGGLVTLRASVSEDDAEGQDGEMLEAEEEEEEGCRATRTEDMNQVPAFVPVGLRSPVPVIAEIEETLEEEAVDFVPYENLEESEESYKEAAQTLLTIGNTCHAPLRPRSPEIVADEQTEGHHVSGTDADTARPTESGVTVGQHSQQEACAIAPSGSQEDDAIKESGDVIPDEVVEEPPSTDVEQEPASAIDEENEQSSASDEDTETTAIPLETSLCGISSIGEHLEQGFANVSGPSYPDMSGPSYPDMSGSQAEEHPTAVDTEEESGTSLSGISLIEEHLQQEDVSLSQLTEALREEPMYLMSDEPTNELPSSADDPANDAPSCTNEEPNELPSCTEDASEFPSCIDEQVNELLSCGEPANELLSCAEQANELPSCSGAGSVEAAVALQAGTSLCSIASIAEHFQQGAASVTQVSDPNSDEPIFIISLTEISPSFIESLPTDPDPPLSHTQLLMCDPQPLSSQPHALASSTTTTSTTTTTSLPCVTDAFPLSTSTMESLVQAAAVVPEPVSAPTEPCPMTSQWSQARDVNTGDVQQTNVESEHRSTRTQEESKRNSAWGAPVGDGNTRAVSHMVFTDALVAVEADAEKDLEREEVPTTASSSTENVVGSAQPGVSVPTEEEPPPAKKTVTRRAKVQVKPALTGRRNVSQKASEESKSTPSTSSSTTTQATVSKASPQSSSIQPPSITSSVATEGTPVGQVQSSRNQPPAPSIALTGRRNIRKQDSEETSPPPCSSSQPVTSKTSPAVLHQPSSTPSGVCTDDTPVVQASDWEAPDHTSTVSHMIVADFLVPVEADVEKPGESGEINTTASSSTGNVVGSAQSGVDLTEEQPAATKRAATRRTKVQVKPALTGRRNVSQKASEESKSTPPPSSSTTQATVSKTSSQSSSIQLPVASSALTGRRNVSIKASEETKSTPPPSSSTTQATVSKASTQSSSIQLPAAPALTGRRNVRKEDSEETSTPPCSSTPPVTSRTSPAVLHQPSSTLSVTSPAASHQPSGVCTDDTPVVQTGDWESPDHTSTVSHMIVTDFLVPVEEEMEKRMEREETNTTAHSSTENVVGSAQPDVSGPTEEEPPPAKKTVTRRAKVQVKPALAGRRNVPKTTSEETLTQTSTPSTCSTQPVANTAATGSSSTKQRDSRVPVHDDSTTVSHMIVTDFLVPVEAEEERPAQGEETSTTSSCTASTENVSAQPDVSAPTEEEAPPAKKTVARRAKVQVKPALTSRRNVSQKASEETKSTPPTSSTTTTTTSTQATVSKASPQSSSVQPPSITSIVAAEETPAGLQSVPDHSVASEWRAAVHDDTSTVSHMIVTDFLVPVEAEVEKHGESEKTPNTARPTTGLEKTDVSGPIEEEPPPAKKTVTRRAKVQVKPALSGRQKVSQKPSEDPSTSAAVQSPPSIDAIISDSRAPVDIDDSTTVSRMIVADFLVPVEADVEKHERITEAHPSARSTTARSARSTIDNVLTSDEPDVSAPTEEEPPPAKKAVTRRAKVQVKPALKGRQKVSQSTSEEPSTSPAVQSTSQTTEDSTSSDSRAPVHDDTTAVSHMIVTDFLVPVEAEVDKPGEKKETLSATTSSTENVVVSGQPDVSAPTEEEPTPAKKTVTRRAKVQVKPALTGRQKASQKASEEPSTSAAAQGTPSIAEDSIISDLTASVGVEDTTTVSHTILTDVLVPVEAEMEKRGEPERAHSSSSSSTEKVPAKTAVTRRAKIQVKPVTATRGTISKSASEEPSTSAVSTPQPIVSIAASTESSSERLPTSVSPQPPSTTDDVHAEEEETPAVQSTPQAPPNPLSRPGRKLKGFLSFMSSTSSSGPGPGATKPAQPRAAAPSTRPCSRPRPAPGPRTKTSSAAASAPDTDTSISSSSSHTSTTERVVPTTTSTHDTTKSAVPTSTHGPTKTTVPSVSTHNITKTAVASTSSRDSTKTAVPSTSTQGSRKTAVPSTSSHDSRRAAPAISSGSTASSVDSADSREVSIRQQSEEPTGVSEYFLSDIFTEVAEDD